MVRRRNQAGILDAADCYRTFKGEYYPAWMSFPSAERIAAYRAAGVRCRRLGDELFIHHADRSRALEIDDQADTERKEE